MSSLCTVSKYVVVTYCWWGGISLPLRTSTVFFSGWSARDILLSSPCWRTRKDYASFVPEACWQSLGSVHSHMLQQLFVHYCMKTDFITAVASADLWMHFTSLRVHEHRPYAILTCKFCISNSVKTLETTCTLFFWVVYARSKTLANLWWDTQSLPDSGNSAVVISSSEHGWQESWSPGFVPCCFTGCMVFLHRVKEG